MADRERKKVVLKHEEGKWTLESELNLNISILSKILGRHFLAGSVTRARAAQELIRNGYTTRLEGEKRLEGEMPESFTERVINVPGEGYYLLVDVQSGPETIVEVFEGPYMFHEITDMELEGTSSIVRNAHRVLKRLLEVLKELEQ